MEVQQPRAGEDEKRCIECGNITDLHDLGECDECGAEHWCINEGGIFDGA